MENSPQNIREYTDILFTADVQRTDLVVLHGVRVCADRKRRHRVGDLLALALARHESASLLRLGLDETGVRRAGRRRARLVRSAVLRRPGYDPAMLVLVRAHQHVLQLLRLVVVQTPFRLQLLHHQRCNQRTRASDDHVTFR